MLSQGNPSTQSPLTERQLECLRGFWLRKSAKMIGNELGVSDHAVNKHLAGVRRRLGVNSTAEAAGIVFEGTRKSTMNYYSQEMEVQTEAELSDQVLASEHFGSEVTGDQGPINNLGSGLTLLAILAVATGSILAASASRSGIAQFLSNRLKRALGRLN